MSKIEKALGRARQSRDGQLVPFPRARSESPEVSAAATATASALQVADNESSRAISAETIARMNEAYLRDRGELAERGIISPGQGDNEVVQAFRELRTRLIQRSAGRNAVIMVTSVSPSGGSSFVSMNLGAAFAFDAGKTALVIDCNIREPSLNGLLAQQGASLGLTDYLESRDLDIGSVIHSVGIERLRVIPAGKQREVPVEYFTSAKTRGMLDALRRRYRERFIILDAPPMTDAADVQTLTELSDFVLLVVRYGRDNRTQIEECVKAIGPKFVGFVFNDEPQLPRMSLREILLHPLRRLFGGKR